MLRKLQAFLVLGGLVVAVPAAAQEPMDEPASEEEDSAAEEDAEPEEPVDEPAAADDQHTSDVSVEFAATSKSQASTEVDAGPADAQEAAPEAEPGDKPQGWHMEIHGYFRAPMALGLSPRPDPQTYDSTTETFSGDNHMQVSYGPARTVDANYYSFAYTRLQEQDWAELTFHAKKEHVDAAIGWMGYWFQAIGYRNSDASWAPGIASLTLDTDVKVLDKPNHPNIALKAGAWWPRFGYLEKYDTYTLGQFRQLGEQVKLTIPVTPDLTATLVQGFGTARDGSFNTTAPAPFQGTTRVDLIHYENISVAYDKYVNVGLHYNKEWTRDPYTRSSGDPGKSYEDVRDAYLSVVGAELGLFAPYAGHLWVSPSYLTIRNGWAMEQGTEVMHSIGGRGIADNYMAFTNTVDQSTGSGTMLNLGFQYENTLSNVLGKEPATEAPEVTLGIFGLLADASLDLPDTAPDNTPEKLVQFKYGADVTFQALNWLAVMARYDEVNYDLDHAGYVFSAISPRVIFSSHFLSGESIYIQYSRYRYGDNVETAGVWPWGFQMVPYSQFYQSRTPYTKPDMDVIRIQATVAF